ncbi:hypothetical protein I8J29_14510 [Paenibacillus sp. MWE-103]|uniref:DUF4025 domain-containing protein n=1 Tax=Paenibacillus artemisiicola TaxID=1172618 RepID=A0ABS3WB94_9BACL|nr:MULTISPECIES: DUF6254 family protein [Paenibacillus]MBO7745421.1 hypothetical protein [Paenibacillus artemisiicola]SFJ70751.1 hypothetical protein SAMN02799624_05608 [Paenibacillus sp. UNC496MF]
MTSPKNRRENAWKSRKQNQKPHGEVKSLAELSDEASSGVAGYVNARTDGD